MYPRDTPPLERFLDAISIEDRGYSTPCWVWQKYRKPDGYATFGVNRKYVLVHRWAYEYWVGPIPAGLQLDHLCRVHECANPEHLEPVTAKENNQRGISSMVTTMINRAKPNRTHCPKGHEYTPENTYIQPRPEGRRPGRACKTCAIQRSSAVWVRKRLAL